MLKQICMFYVCSILFWFANRLCMMYHDNGRACNLSYERSKHITLVRSVLAYLTHKNSCQKRRQHSTATHKYFTRTCHTTPAGRLNDGHKHFTEDTIEYHLNYILRTQSNITSIIYWGHNRISPQLYTEDTIGCHLNYH